MAFRIVPRVRGIFLFASGLNGQVPPHHCKQLSSCFRHRLWTRNTHTETVPLAYELLEPASGPKAGFDSRNSPLLFLHGFFGSKKNNRSVSKAISKDLGRHVYVIDLRNHGDSPHHPRHDYPSMARDVRAFMAEHGIKTPTIIGHSMGAKTAMAVALESPELVQDVIVVDNAPIDAALHTDFGKYIRGMQRVEAAGVTRQDEADKILREYEKSLPIRQFLLGNLHRPEGSPHRKFRVPLDILARSLGHLGDFPFRHPDAGGARFEKPALFVRGTHSPYVPDEVLPVVGQFFPKFELVDIDSGHWVTAEKPEDFRQVVRFLNSRD